MTRRSRPFSGRHLLLAAGLFVASLFVASLFSVSLAQPEGVPVVLVHADGSETPFEIELHRGETPFVRYHDGEQGRLGTVRVERDGEIVTVPIDEVARIDRIQFMDTRWLVTLRDGTVLEAPSDVEGAFFELAGTPGDGSRVRWTIAVRSNQEVPFVGVVFAPELGYPEPAGGADDR